MVLEVNCELIEEVFDSHVLAKTNTVWIKDELQTAPSQILRKLN